MMSQVSKVFLKNTIRHTDTHNRIIEEDEMWRQLQKTKQRKTTGNPKSHNVRSSCVQVPRAHMDRSENYDRHSYMDREESLEDKRNTFWLKKMQEAEENDPNRWGHAGFREQNPELFCPSDSASSGEEVVVKRKTTSQEKYRKKSSSHKDKKSHKKGHKEKKKKKDKKKKKKSHKVKKDKDSISGEEWIEGTTSNYHHSKHSSKLTNRDYQKHASQSQGTSTSRDYHCSKHTTNDYSSESEVTNTKNNCEYSDFDDRNRTSRHNDYGKISKSHQSTDQFHSGKRRKDISRNRLATDRDRVREKNEKHKTDSSLADKLISKHRRRKADERAKKRRRLDSRSSGSDSNASVSYSSSSSDEEQHFKRKKRQR